MLQFLKRHIIKAISSLRRGGSALWRRLIENVLWPPR
jgi:hypothetical protein